MKAGNYCHCEFPALKGGAERTCSHWRYTELSHLLCCLICNSGTSILLPYLHLATNFAASTFPFELPFIQACCPSAWICPRSAKGCCHGFVTLLLVFHIITSWTKEKNYVSQRTSRSQKEDTSRNIHHLVACGPFHFQLLPGRVVGVISKPCTCIK